MDPEEEEVTMTRSPSRVRVSGPLAEHAVGFAEELTRRGYAPESVARHVQLLAHLSRWLDGQGLDGSDLSEERLAEFLAARRAEGYTVVPSLRWISTLAFLPALEVAPGVAAAPTPLEVMLDDYNRYLSEERGLAEWTIRGYVDVARLFLSCWQQLDGTLDLSQVTAEDVTAFVVGERHRRSIGSAQVSVTALRSLLRFLFLEGHIAQQLGPGGAGRFGPEELLASRFGCRGGGSVARQLRHLRDSGNAGFCHLDDAVTPRSSRR
jgi:integrase/recombinase XerD